MDISLDTRKCLDKFYTKPEISKKCWELMNEHLDESYQYIVEPSAGSGSMLNAITGFETKGFDLMPENDNIIANDFLMGDAVGKECQDKKIAFFGNPPFGKKSDLAVKFINKALELSDIVGFILPNQFKKFSAQKRIIKEAKLIFEIDLPKNSFVLGDDEYDVGCVFQIWSTKESDAVDNRIHTSPSTKHEEFEMYQYNCTKTALKFFDYEWDFAVLRQGYGNFNQKYRVEDKSEMSVKKQWIFFKAKNKDVLKKLESLNFNKIAELNTSVKGFGKADVIKFYDGGETC
ncbi:MAG: hypothetical protein ACRC0G_12575 [Fusobacteriaceae bacterium]